MNKYDHKAPESEGMNLNLNFVFNTTFSNISATCISWRPVLVVEEAGGPGEPPTLGKQLVNFITCGCKSNAPFFVIYKGVRELTPYHHKWNVNKSHTIQNYSHEGYGTMEFKFHKIYL